MAYLYEKRRKITMGLTGTAGQILFIRIHEYAPGETLIVGGECTFPQLEK